MKDEAPLSFPGDGEMSIGQKSLIFVPQEGMDLKWFGF